MNQILKGLTISPAVLFLLISFVNSTSFDVTEPLLPPSTCCTSDTNNAYFDAATVSVPDPSLPGRKLRVAASVNFGHSCSVEVCLNDFDCVIPSLGSYCGLECLAPEIPLQPIELVFNVDKFVPNGTNTLTFTSTAYCSSLINLSDGIFVRLLIVTCGDGVVESDFEQCDNTTGCDPQSCQCMTGYTYNSTGQICDKNCGNSVIDPDEDCEITTLGCDPNTCLCMRGYQPVNETCERTCDDGVLQPEFEDCDGGLHCIDCSCAPNYFNITQLYCGTCGNKILDDGEECDSGVGCTNCTCSSEYVAVNSTSCSLCGNGKIDVDEQCEVGFSGCDAECKCSAGYAGATPPTNDCLRKCGNGVIDDGELCEIGGNGCSDTCQCQSDYTPNFPPTKDCINALVQDPNYNPMAGTIAGAVIGSVVGAGLIALGAMYLLYRRKKKAGKKSKAKSDRSEHEAELVDKPRPERVQSEASLVSDRSGTQLTSFNDTSTTENSATDSYLPTKSKTDLERSEDIL
jgi:hypothetical protein